VWKADLGQKAQSTRPVNPKKESQHKNNPVWMNAWVTVRHWYLVRPIQRKLNPTVPFKEQRTLQIKAARALDPRAENESGNALVERWVTRVLATKLLGVCYENTFVAATFIPSKSIKPRITNNGSNLANRSANPLISSS
jgi:hypothetical protein